jgi:hypothetical protein
MQKGERPMPGKDDSMQATRKALLEKLSTGAGEPIDKPIHFQNDDIPKYRKHVARLKNSPSRIRVTTG